MTEAGMSGEKRKKCWRLNNMDESIYEEIMFLDDRKGNKKKVKRNKNRANIYYYEEHQNKGEEIC